MKKPRAAKTIGRKQRAAGWTLLVLGVLVAGVWAASGWRTIVYSSTLGSFYCGSGVVLVGSPTPRKIGDGLIDWRGSGETGWGRWQWWYGFNAKQGAYGLYIRDPRPNFPYLHWILLWPIPLLLWTPAALLLRSGIVARRRAITSACPKCGYSLAGLGKDAPCPECGKGGGTK